METADEKKHIAQLCDLLRPSHPVRFVAMRVLNNELVLQSDIRLLIETLRNPVVKPWWSKESLLWIVGRTQIHPEHTVREIAAWALGQINLTPEDKYEAGGTLAWTILSRTSQEVRIEQASLLRTILRSSLLGQILNVLLYLGRENPNSVPDWIGLLFAMAVTGSVLGLLMSPLVLLISNSQEKRPFHKMRAAAAIALAQYQIPESIYTLSEAFRDSNAEVGEAAYHTLQATLPTLTPEHYGKLPAETVSSLCRALEYSKDRNAAFIGDWEEFALQIMDALEKIGDGSALPLITRWANRERNIKVRSAAITLLPILEARAERENAREMLLRGSQQPPVASETLLRPAVAAPDTTPTEQLLRPHISE